MLGAEENAFLAIKDKVPVINFSLGKGDKLIKPASLENPVGNVSQSG
jgi:enoyl-[acyl-carrier protein] reductase II